MDPKGVQVSSQERKSFRTVCCTGPQSSTFRCVENLYRVWRTSPVKQWDLSGFDAPARRAPGTSNAHRCFCAWILNHGDQGSFSPAHPPLCLTPCSLQLGTDMQLMKTTPLIEVPSRQLVNVFALTSKVSVLFLFLCGWPHRSRCCYSEPGMLLE